MVCVAQFMVVLDVSIVNVALPDIRDDLGMSQAGLAWVLNAYTLAFAGFLLLGGRAADLYGRKRLFLLGVAVFAGASLLGGIAQTGGQLIAARALQGLGGAILSPATLTILTTTFTDRGLARAPWASGARSPVPVARRASSPAAYSPISCPGAGSCSSTSRSVSRCSLSAGSR